MAAQWLLDLWKDDEFRQIFNYSVDQAGPRAIVNGELMLDGQVAELSAASELAGLGAIAAGALPVLAQVGVFVALGAGYYQAREIAKQEETTSGFSQGFVLGILNWSISNVSNLFYRHGVIHINSVDEQLNVIRVVNFDRGLISGFLLGSALPDSLQEAFVSGLRKLAGHPATGHWTRNDQISFVIALATTLRRHSVR